MACSVACSPAGETDFYSQTVPQEGAAGPGFGRGFQLSDQHGQTRRLEDFRGQVVLLFFGYTHCPDYCPTTLSNLMEVMRLLGPDSTRLQVVFVTLDPARDNPEVLARYMAQFHPRFIALHGDAASLRAVAQEYRVIHLRQPHGTDQYRIDHSSYTYIHDTRGRLRLYTQQGEAAAHMAADVRRLLAEEP